jgi:hypothetical protein
MKKLKTARSVMFTFEEGCNKYSENCGEEFIAVYFVYR